MAAAGIAAGAAEVRVERTRRGMEAIMEKRILMVGLRDSRSEKFEKSL